MRAGATGGQILQQAPAWGGVRSAPHRLRLCLREALQAYVAPDMSGEYQRVLDDCVALGRCRARSVCTSASTLDHKSGRYARASSSAMRTL